jgi:hypothetical protein
MSQEPGIAAADLDRQPSPVVKVESERFASDSARASHTAVIPHVPQVTESSTCVNCGAPLTALFCAECGQRTRPTRLSVRGVASDVITRITSADRGFVHTAYRLTVAPGDVIRDYISGRTVVYSHPFGYLIFAFAAFAILSGVFGGTTGTGGAENRLFIALIVPFMAFAARLLLWRGDLNYAEHLIAAGYVIAHVALFFGIMQAAIPFVSGDPGGRSAYVLFYGALSVAVAFVVWAYSRLSPARPLLGGVCGLLSLAGGIALWAMFMMAVLHLIRG